MSVDPRAALATFVSALERHLEVSASRHGDNDPTVLAAYQDVADAFDAYDDALMESFGEVTPLEIYSGDDDGDEPAADDEDDDDFDDAEFDDEDDEPYQGLEEDEYDEEDLREAAPRA